MNDSHKVKIEMGFGDRVEAFEVDEDTFFAMLQEFMDGDGSDEADSAEQWVRAAMAKHN